MSRFVNPVPQFTLEDRELASAGKLYFYETGTTTKKDTYSDFEQTIRNTNPVILSGEGRCPSIFGNGRYTVVFTSADDIEQWTRDNVELSTELGQYADWSAILTYRINDIVRGPDGEYYRSITSTNTGNNPETSTANWEQIAFLSYWNTNVSYGEDDIVIYNGNMYRSGEDENEGNNPEESSTNVWKNTSEPSEWLSTIEYQEGDLVVYSGNLYESMENDNSGNQPDEASTDTWRNINEPSEWLSSKQYEEDNLVIYEGTLYRSLTDFNTGNQPDDSTGDWANLVIERQLVELTGNDSIIDSNFNATYFYESDSTSHIVQIAAEEDDEGATVTRLICRQSSDYHLEIELGSVTAAWSFDESESIDGYQIQPGEIVELVKVGTDSYLAYAPNGISKVVNLGGDFGSSTDEVKFTRNGNWVGVASLQANAASSDSVNESASGVIPAIFRPTLYDFNSVVYFSGDSLIRVNVSTSGTYLLDHRDWSGSSSTGGGRALTFGYQIA